jgi:hypothetical protein
MMMKTAPSEGFRLPSLPQNLVVLNQHLNDYYMTEGRSKTGEYSDFWRNLSRKLKLLKMKDKLPKKTVASILKSRTMKIQK